MTFDLRDHKFIFTRPVYFRIFTVLVFSFSFYEEIFKILIDFEFEFALDHCG